MKVQAAIAKAGRSAWLAAAGRTARCAFLASLVCIGACACATVASMTAAQNASPTLGPSPGASPSPISTAAPATGAGGTAGVQDGWLFGLGGAAILAGAGGMAYRYKLMRNR